MVKGEGKTIITLVPERRILLYVLAMAGGVILDAAWPDADVLTMLAAASAGMLSGAIAFRGHVGSLQAGRWHLAIVFLALICTGLESTWWQLAQAPPAIEKGVRADFTGVVARVDGRIDERLRIWLRVEKASRCSASPGCSRTTTCCGWAGANWSPVPHPVSISGSVR